MGGRESDHGVDGGHRDVATRHALRPACGLGPDREDPGHQKLTDDQEAKIADSRKECRLKVQEAASDLGGKAI